MLDSLLQTAEGFKQKCAHCLHIMYIYSTGTTHWV